MNDASGRAYSESITAGIRLENGKHGSYVITYTVDPSYLMDDNRHYPVTIDPTLTWKNDANLCDVCVCSGSDYKDTNYYGTSTTCVNMKSGKGTKGIYRTYIKFVDLGTAVKNRYVEKAVFSMYETAYSGKGQTVQAYRVTGSWGKTTLKWSNRPGFTNLYDTVTSTATNKKLRQLDLTQYCRGLAKSSFSNYGIMLKGADETGKYCEFHGSRYSTNTSLRPKLVITYYEKPATATSASVTPAYIKPGGTYTLEWSGITAHALDYTQYKIARYNASTGEDDLVLIPYSTSTKAGKTSSGSKKLTATSQMTDGRWHIYVRGVDKAGIHGNGKGTSLFIDGTLPASGTLTTVPSSTAASPATSRTPKIKWIGFTDTNLKTIEYSINGGSYAKAGTSASGSLTISEEDMPVSGAYTISVRATDKAGNKRVKSIVYYLQIPVDISGYVPVNGFSIRNEYGKNGLSWQTGSPLGKYCYYKIYRGTTAGFTPSEGNLAGDRITGTHWTDISSAETGAVYKVQLVCNDAQGNLLRSEMLGTVSAPARSDDGSFSSAEGTGHDYRAYEELSHPTCSLAVDEASGNLVLSQTDAELPSAQIPFVVQRSYNSKASYTGMFGTGWSDSIHKNLIREEDGSMLFVDSDGTVYRFEQTASGYECLENKKYELKAGEPGEEAPIDAEEIDKLLSSEDMCSYRYDMGGSRQDEEETDDTTVSITAEHCYTVKDDQGMLYRFDDGGNLISVIEPNDTYLLYIYDEAGRVCKVITNSLKYIDISYDQDGRAARIDLPDESYLSYGYNDGMLVSVTLSSADNSESISQSYAYDGNGRMILVPDGENNLYTVTYAGGKLTEFEDPSGAKTCFSYGDGETAVQKKTSAGTRVAEYTVEYDSYERLTAATDTLGRETQYTYGDPLFSPGRMYLVTSETKERGYETYQEGTHTISLQEGTVTCDTVYDRDQ